MYYKRPVTAPILRNRLMIVVTHLNGSQFAINPDLIEKIHANPDTTLSMVDGSFVIVREPLEDVIEIIRGYRASVLRMARDLPDPPQPVAKLAAVPARPTGK